MSGEEADRFEPIHPPSTPATSSRDAPTTPGSPTSRSRGTSASNSYLRNAGRRFSTSGMPLGFFQASGQVVSSAPSLKDIQTGNLDGDGWSGVGQRRNSVAWKAGDGQVLENIALQRSDTGLSISRRYSVAQPPILEEPKKGIKRAGTTPVDNKIDEKKAIDSSGNGLLEAKREAVLGENAISEAGDSSMGKADVVAPHDPSVPYPNGYQFPPKHTKMQSVRIGLKAYWRFLWTWFGFLLTIYALNIVAWGGMLFLVLIGGAPASMFSPYLFLFSFHHLASLPYNCQC